MELICRLCDHSGLAWFTDRGNLVRHDDLRGNTAYECKHSDTWAQETTAAIAVAYDGPEDKWPDPCKDHQHDWMAIGAYLWCQSCRRSEKRKSA